VASVCIALPTFACVQIGSESDDSSSISLLGASLVDDLEVWFRAEDGPTVSGATPSASPPGSGAPPSTATEGPAERWIRRHLVSSCFELALPRAEGATDGAMCEADAERFVAQHADIIDWGRVLRAAALRGSVFLVFGKQREPTRHCFGVALPPASPMPGFNRGGVTRLPILERILVKEQHAQEDNGLSLLSPLLAGTGACTTACSAISGAAFLTLLPPPPASLPS